MTPRAHSLLFVAGLVAAGLALAGCSSPRQDFTILSGSENQVLEPVVQEFCAANNFNCSFKYLGSLDIAFSLKPGADSKADAVWPAASIWVDVYDSARSVKSLKSITQPFVAQ